MSLLEGLMALGGAGLVGVFAWLKISRDKAVRKAADAKGREEAAVGRQQRDQQAREQSEPIRVQDEEQRREHAATQARLDAEIEAIGAVVDSERARTEAAAVAGGEALTERVNGAIREGKLPRGRPQ